MKENSQKSKMRKLLRADAFAEEIVEALASGQQHFEHGLLLLADADK